ncbi:MAG: hypothetical protein SGILL_007292, partial [Bacillariaceae sp.]
QPAKEKKSSKPNRLWDSINPPETVGDDSGGTFKGMVQAGILWMNQCAALQLTSDKKQQVLELYHPKKESCSKVEKSVIELSEHALAYLQEHAATSATDTFSTFDDWDTLQRVLLVWACNSFQGGRVYDTISRINHSCNPNAVIVTTGDDGEGQRVVAATKISSGTEIKISYLGLLLYADTATRQKKLADTKYFICGCSRCESAPSQEGAARIPCPTCHPRHPTQLCLDEDVQYDDDGEVQYICYGGNCKTCQKAPTQAGSKLEKVNASVCDKIGSFLNTYETLNSGSHGDAESSSDNDNDENDAVLEEHVSLASTMMGNKHWTTNLTLLLHLDRRLSAMSKKMITTHELPSIEDIAEAIDSLQRLFGYAESLQLDLDAGHVLGDVTIGVSQKLVSLGDEKSQKYGAEWLDKINDYVENFGNEGLQKVVAALKGAWKKHDRSDDCNEPKQSKKAKV